MKFLTPLLAVICVVSLIGNVLIYERFNLRKPIVTVGSDPISVYKYDQAMETTPAQQGTLGSATLRKIVFEDLVRQAATKQGLMPTEEDVKDRIAELAVHQPQMAQQAASPAVQEDLKTDIALENLRIQNVTASDAEINAFYNNNKALFTVPSQVQTTMVVSQHQADADKAEHLLQEDVKPETIATQPGLHVAGVNGFNINMQALPPAVSQQIGKTVLSMNANEIKTISIPGGYFLTFKVKNTHPNELQPLSAPKVKEQVARQVKLRKAVSPQQELATLYQGNTPVFNVSKYSSFFNDIQQNSARNTKKTASAQ
jgi:hypothetical protein